MSPGLGTFRELANVEAPAGCKLGWWPHPPAWSSMDRGRFKTDGEYSLDHARGAAPEGGSTAESKGLFGTPPLGVGQRRTDTDP